MEVVFDPSSKQVPPIIEETIAHIEKNCMENCCYCCVTFSVLHVEGLFRHNGRETDIREFKQRYDRGESCMNLTKEFTGGKNLELYKIQDPHTVPGILKSYLRNLPEPIFSFEYYEAFRWALSKLIVN